MKLKQHIPNTISLLNALFGAFSIYATLWCRNLELAIICMLMAALMDFFDGFAARKLQAFSPLGKDIDSLSDTVSFGVAPSCMMLMALDAIDFALPALALIVVPASVYRLAKFNNDTRQTATFIGLPTPANALLLAGLAFFTVTNADSITGAPLSIVYKIMAIYPVIIVGLSYLLVSEVPMFSLKSSQGHSKTGHLIRVICVVVSTLIGVLLWSFSGLAVGLGLYLLINLWDFLKGMIPE